MRPASLIAPRVAVYLSEAEPPSLEDGWIALPRLAHSPGREAVFGDGSHPTTRLCAGVVDILCRQRRPKAVLDVGTGTGILARIARARGAVFVAATDIDPVALSCAEAHSHLDAHAVEIHLCSEAPDYWGARFDLVVANILEAPLHHLAPALCRALRPGGVLLLSGFTRPQSPALRVLYEQLGLIFVSESHLDGWALLMLGSSQTTSMKSP
jgi:ribosomal protein L11 methyltransferase